MNKIVFAALLSLVAGSTSLLFPQAAKADTVIYCHPVTDNRVLKNSADNAHAYADGYREGEQSARNGEAYKPRTAGGEFAHGFEDGYFNRPLTSPQVVAQHTTEDCNTDGYYTAAPPPAVVYSPYIVAPPPAVIYRAPYPFIDFDFGFGRRYYGWRRY